MSIKKSEDKRELQIAKQNNINYAVLSDNMNLFREGCLEKIKHASGYIPFYILSRLKFIIIVIYF